MRKLTITGGDPETEAKTEQKAPGETQQPPPADQQPENGGQGNQQPEPA